MKHFDHEFPHHDKYKYSEEPYPEPWHFSKRYAEGGAVESAPAPAPVQEAPAAHPHVDLHALMLQNVRNNLMRQQPAGGPVGGPAPAVPQQSPLDAILANTALPDHLKELLVMQDAARKANV